MFFLRRSGLPYHSNAKRAVFKMEKESSETKDVKISLRRLKLFKLDMNFLITFFVYLILLFIKLLFCDI